MICAMSDEPRWSLDGVPEKPGVYLFRDAAGEVLYGGKALSLKARLRSDLRPGGIRPKASQMPFWVLSLPLVLQPPQPPLNACPIASQSLLSISPVLTSSQYCHRSVPLPRRCAL